MSDVCFGRLPRAHDPRVPHMSALLSLVPPQPKPPPSIDWTRGMPASLGMFMNDKLGCCTCAAVYHALQVWSFNAAQAMDTEPDADVLALYEVACGYNPSDPSTDQGGIEQSVLAYWLNNGVPVQDQELNPLIAFVEVDPRNTDDVKRAIANCGVAYIGFDVPQYLADSLLGAGSTWDIETATDTSIAGGHAVILAGYDAIGVRVISWGNYYTMTWAFFARYVDEVYALADYDWINAKLTTPGGLSVADLQTQMEALKQ